MNNFSKNNYSKKNTNKDNRRSRSKNNYNFNSSLEEGFQSGKKNYNKKNDLKRRNSLKKSDEINSKEYSHFRSKEKSSNNINQTKRNFSSNFSNIEKSPDNEKKLFQSKFNDKNFDDWIWGKHSVLAVLNSKRPINRIWCTTEIFSSEKFFILLKGLKSKGVLIEEVSWSRLSQLTCGAVHQGVALQLSSSQTLSLDKLIDISTNKSINPIIVALDGITVLKDDLQV